MNSDVESGRHRGLELMVHARDVWQSERLLFLVPVTDLWIARNRAEAGDRDAAIAVMRNAVADIYQAERSATPFGATCVLVETLLERGSEADLAEAQREIDRLASLPATEGSVVRDITLLRLRVLMARACGDDIAYKDLASRYRAMAESLGFEGHIAWAEAMIE